MISNSNNSVDDIINNLSPIEKSILYECGKINASVNKNVSEDTLKKKLSNKNLKGFSKAKKSLLSKGLLVKYRSGNYGVSKEGRIIMKRIQEERQKDIYKGLRILMIFD